MNDFVEPENDLKQELDNIHYEACSHVNICYHNEIVCINSDFDESYCLS